ncbi:type II CAAX prenyl endopeptidase Rce1 family protein [Candidatus Uabimicrobium sp. HlEnr_7]|uniref:CPBP family glutamic-type intramembrane protease n=1 Tax=Candidatus Uabimicrobium helgolandensis TaxID=3095367 RepID=UPI003556E795
MNNVNLLPQTKTYEQLSFAFIAPYFCYVLLNILNDFFALWIVYVIKIIVVGSLLVFTRYSFNKIHLRDILYGFVLAPFLLLLWIVPYYTFFNITDSFPKQTLATIANPEFYWILRTLASVILVAIFEELFFRVYLLEFLFQAQQNKHTSIIDKCGDTLNNKPQDLKVLPLNKYSIIGTIFLFTLGHSVSEYISCILYFSITLVIYKYLRSLWVCIIIHALTNLGIAVLVKYWGMNFLWF